MSLGERKQAVKRGEPKNEIAVLAHEIHHRIDWNVAQVKTMEADYWKRKAIEPIQIKANS